MKDWIERLDAILSLNGREILQHTGGISHKIAVEKSGSEYQKFKELQKGKLQEASLKELEEDIKNITMTLFLARGGKFRENENYFLENNVIPIPNY